MARMRDSCISNITSNLSDDTNASNRYKDKVKQLGLNFDPYSLTNEKFMILNSNASIDEVPHITYPDIYHYLIDYPNYFTHKSLKTFKSLEAYNFVLSGWVDEVLIYQLAKDSRSDRYAY